MQLIKSADKQTLGRLAAASASRVIRAAISAQGFANVIIATGASQFATLEHLVQDRCIEWGKVTLFHLDEYIDLPVTHPASFQRYLRERFLAHVPPPKTFHFISGAGDPAVECARLNALIAQTSIDLAFVGIGENGHLAFNDPPADFETEVPFLVLTLNAGCRQQQFGEGWFESLDLVPRQAISMSIRQIMKSTHIVGSVPDARKARAVRDCLQGPVTNLHPSSILQRHANCEVFVDEDSAALLGPA
ncbi:MAG: glucosamine-6-phosphate deaminase [Verrucomicrobiota bacterium]